MRCYSDSGKDTQNNLMIGMCRSKGCKAAYAVVRKGEIETGAEKVDI